MLVGVGAYLQNPLGEVEAYQKVGVGVTTHEVEEDQKKVHWRTLGCEGLVGVQKSWEEPQE